MKKILFLSIISTALFFSGCKKDGIVSTETNVGNSTITYFVDLALTGASTMTISKGDTFSDPGAVATENGKAVTVSVAGAVDNSKPGIYVLTYSAVNKDGFAKSVSRTVVVAPGNEMPGVDLSGTYSATNGLVATVSKIGNGAYFMTNCNHPLTPIAGYFFSTDGLAISFPKQMTNYGEMYSTAGTYTPATKKAVWTLTIPSAGYTRTRTFTRQ